MKEFEEDFKLL